MATKKRLSKRIIALIIAGGFIAIIGFTLLGFYIGFWALHGNLRTWTPDYEMLSEEELKAIYDKETLEESDYEILFKQTGLTHVGIDRARAQTNGWNKVLSIHQFYFKEYGIHRYDYATLVCTEYLANKEFVEMTYLERGDIIISSATHFSGFKIGHSAIVTQNWGQIYQSNRVGEASGYSTANAMFANRINFMVVRIKPEYFSETLEDGTLDEQSYRNNLDRVAGYIETQFADVPYSVFTGVFTKKDGMKATTCSHMLWYGFKHFDDCNGGKFNLDLDSNGRLLAMPKDISESPYVELVQTFGFDPEKMY